MRTTTTTLFVVATAALLPSGYDAFVTVAPGTSVWARGMHCSARKFSQEEYDRARVEIASSPIAFDLLEYLEELRPSDPTNKDGSHAKMLIAEQRKNWEAKLAAREAETSGGASSSSAPAAAPAKKEKTPAPEKEKAAPQKAMDAVADAAAPVAAAAAEGVAPAAAAVAAAPAQQQKKKKKNNKKNEKEAAA